MGPKYLEFSPLERSENDRALQSRNSAETDCELPNRNSDAEAFEYQSVPSENEV